MKEEICESILEENERQKWFDILDDVIKDEPFKSFNDEVIESEKKTKYTANVSYAPYYMGQKNMSLLVYINEQTTYKNRKQIKNPGWFSGYREEEYWEKYKWDDFQTEHKLFCIDYIDKIITIYDERVYDYCNEFGKKHKFKKLKKCWEGVDV